MINKSKEEQEEDKKNDHDVPITAATTKRIDKATLIETANIFREVFASVLWQLYW